MEVGEKLYTPLEFAELAKVCRANVYELIKQGRIPAYMVGSRLRIPHSAFESMKVVPSKSGPVVISDKLACINDLGDLEVLDDL